jgi:hypothetical protein
MSEWLRAFNSVVSCYFLVLFEEGKESVKRSGAKYHNIKYCVGKEHYVVLVIHTLFIYICLSSLLQVFTEVKKT